MYGRGVRAPGLLFRDIFLDYGGAPLFAGLNFAAVGGRWTVVLGASGVGKTSLLKIAAGLLRPRAGLATTSEGAALAGQVAYMAQTDLLYPWLDVAGNVALGARLRGERADRARVMSLLDQVGLTERAGALPAALSGGQRQRVALARTLYEGRPIVLMDEPFSALDSLTRARIQDLAAVALAGRTVLMITHDPAEACRLAHDIVVMTGAPAVLEGGLSLPGAPPRVAHDAAVLRTQAGLLERLAGL